ncbi:MAG TPA: RNA methyltransferase [Thermotogota bacterium]|nr:RNA methyltransferase [Thermotogota bacterium]HRW92760.1 RNA methyltransferase [Thermotogota bacterium]
MSEDFDAIARAFLDQLGGRAHFAGAKNGRVKQVLSLVNNTRPNPEQLFVMEGLWAHQLALSRGIRFHALFCSPERLHSPETRSMVQGLVEQGVDTYVLSEKLFLRLSERENPDGLLSICQLPRFSLAELEAKKTRMLVVLDGIEIPGNIGTILRSCDGAGAQGVLVVNRRARLTHPKILKGSQGALFSVPVVECAQEEAAQWLLQNKFELLLTDTDAPKTYHELRPHGPIAIIAGSERYGISPEWYALPHTAASIPMRGDCDSLNVAVSTSIVLYYVAQALFNPSNPRKSHQNRREHREMPG